MNKNEKKGCGKIYKIESPQIDDIYIGSTFKNRLCDRMAAHRYEFRNKEKRNKYYSVFEILKFDDAKIYEISRHENITKSQLLFLENEEIKKNKKKINKNLAKQTREEWVEKNNDKIKNYYKKYREENKEKIKEYMKKYRENKKKK